MTRGRLFNLFKLFACIGSLGAASACHKNRVVTESIPTSWQYCWWTLLLTPTPPDSVAMRFADAFKATGQVNPQWTAIADTAFAHAGPTPIDGWPTMKYWSRLVAYRQQDTTRYRYYVTRTGVIPDSSAARAFQPISVCGQIFRAASLTGWKPSRDPNYQDSMAVWNRLK